MKSLLTIVASLAVLSAACEKKPAKISVKPPMDSGPLIGVWYVPVFAKANTTRLELDGDGQWRLIPAVSPGEESATSPGPTQQGSWTIQEDRLNLQVVESKSCKIKAGDTFHFRILSVSRSTAYVADPFSYTSIIGHKNSAPETGVVTWTRQP